MKLKSMFISSMIAMLGIVCVGCSSQQTIDNAETTISPVTQADTEVTIPSSAPEQTTEQYTTSVSTEPLTTRRVDLNKYVGLYSYNPNNEGDTGSIKVGILSIDENQAEIEVMKSSPNYAHLAGGKFAGTITDENRIDFTMTDSFSNVCSGYILLYDDSIYMKSDIVEKSEPYMYGMIIDNTIEKISDSVSKNDFI